MATTKTTGVTYSKNTERHSRVDQMIPYQHKVTSSLEILHLSEKNISPAHT